MTRILSTRPWSLQRFLRIAGVLLLLTPLAICLHDLVRDGQLPPLDADFLFRAGSTYVLLVICVTIIQIGLLPRFGQSCWRRIILAVGCATLITFDDNVLERNPVTPESFLLQLPTISVILFLIILWLDRKPKVSAEHSSPVG